MNRGRGAEGGGAPPGRGEDTAGRGGAGAGAGSARGGAADSGARCALCHRGAEAGQRPLLLGGVLASCGELLGPFQGSVYVHRLCALWSPEVFQDGDRLRNVMAAVRRGRQLNCAVCGRKGATIGCRLDWCPKTYHLHCAAGQGGCEFQTDGSWVVSCPAHRVGGGAAETKAAEVARIRRNNSRSGGRGVAAARKRLLEMPSERGAQEGGGAGGAHAAAAVAGGDHDRDEEMFQRKQQRRYARDVAALAPKVLGRNKAQVAAASPGTAAAGGGWASVGGLDHVVAQLKEMVVLPLLYAEDLKALHVQPPRGILLHGEPGTGKTHVVRALAGSLEQAARRPVTFFSRKGADCLGKFHGDAERTLRILFEEATKKQPSIIFFDEIDGLAPSRGSRADPIHASVVSTLLSLMDGVADRGQVIVVGATNRPDSIDPALRRPGRFDREVHFPLPETAARKAIFNVHTRHWQHPPDDCTLTFLSEATHRFAGADIRALCSAAVLCAVRERMPDGLPTPSASLEEGSLNTLDDSSRKFDLNTVVVNEKHWREALQRAAKPCSARSLHSSLSLDAQRQLPWAWVPYLSRTLTPALGWLAGVLPAPSETLLAIRAAAQQRSSFPTTINHSPEEILAGTGALLPSPSQRHMEDTKVRQDKTAVKERRSEDAPNASSGRKLCTLLVCGQDVGGHEEVASATLSVASEFCEIHIASLPALLSAGNGDPAAGAAHVAAQARSSSRPGRPSIIFLPRIETWAFSAVILDTGAVAEAPDGSFPQGMLRHGAGPQSHTLTPAKAATSHGFEGMQDAQNRSWAPSPTQGTAVRGTNSKDYNPHRREFATNMVLPAWKMFSQVISDPCVGQLYLIATSNLSNELFPPEILRIFRGNGHDELLPPNSAPLLNKIITVAAPSDLERQAVIQRVARTVTHEFSDMLEAFAERAREEQTGSDVPLALETNDPGNPEEQGGKPKITVAGRHVDGEEEREGKPAALLAPAEYDARGGTTEDHATTAAPPVMGSDGMDLETNAALSTPLPSGRNGDEVGGRGKGDVQDNQTQEAQVFDGCDEEEEDDTPPCCVCLARDGPKKIYCRRDGCERSAHPRCVKEKRKSTTWTCALCSRNESLRGHRLEKLVETEVTGLKWIGGSLLRDPRCAVACSAEPDNGEWYGAADLAAVATLAGQGKYRAHEDFSLALHRALSIGQKAERDLMREQKALGHPTQEYSTRAAALAGLLDTAEGWLYDLKKHLRQRRHALLVEQQNEEIYERASGAAASLPTSSEHDKPPQSDIPTGGKPVAMATTATPPGSMPPAPLSETARKNLASTLETALRSSLGEALGASWRIRDAEDAMRSALAESRTVLLCRSRGVGPPPTVPDAGPIRTAVRRALAPLLPNP